MLPDWYFFAGNLPAGRRGREEREGCGKGPDLNLPITYRPSRLPGFCLFKKLGGKYPITITPAAGSVQERVSTFARKVNRDRHGRDPKVSPGIQYSVLPDSRFVFPELPYSPL